MKYFYKSYLIKVILLSSGITFFNIIFTCISYFYFKSSFEKLTLYLIILDIFFLIIYCTMLLYFLGNLKKSIKELLINGTIKNESFMDPLLYEIYRHFQKKLEELNRERQILKSLTNRYHRDNQTLYLDSMTKLYTKEYLYKIVSLQVRKSITLHLPFSILMIDVDNFKKYNDTHGHPMGDIVLKKVAEILLNSIRSNDIAIRFGGEEFLLYLSDAPKRYSIKVAERIRKTIEETQFPNEHTQPLGKITVSIGIASFPEDGNDLENLIKIADDNLYEAKNSGRNRIYYI